MLHLGNLRRAHTQEGELELNIMVLQDGLKQSLSKTYFPTW